MGVVTLLFRISTYSRISVFICLFSFWLGVFAQEESPSLVAVNVVISVKDVQTNLPLPNTKLQITDTNDVMFYSRTKADTLPYKVWLPNGVYYIEISAKCHLVSRQRVEVKDSKTLYNRGVRLQRITDCENRYASDIMFNSNDSLIAKLDLVYLDSLCATVLKEQNLKIVLVGNVDHSEDVSLGLSRARVAKNYLISRGYPAERIEIKNGGLDYVIIPIDIITSFPTKEEQEAAMAKNRRLFGLVEFH